MRLRTVLLVTALSGCFDLPPRGPPDGGGSLFGDAGCDAPALFARSCVTGCHDAVVKQGNLDLATLPLEPRLFGKHASARPDYLLIDPELPDESALVVKLSSMPPFGAQMPLGQALSAGDRACVQAWVDAVVDAGLSDAGFTGADAGSDAGAGDGGAPPDGGALPDAGAFDAGRFWGPLADDAGCAPAVDAGQWCIFQVVPEPLYAVRGLASDDIWAVGSRGAAYHYDGTSWSRSDSGVGVTLFDVFPVAADDVWAVGERGLVLHFDSSGWQAQSWSPSSVMDAGLLASGQPTWDLGGVWVEGGDVWVAGGGSTLAHRVGGAMQVVQTSHPNMPQADFIRLYARNANEWWAGGDITFFEWDGVAPGWSQGRGAIMRAFGMAGSVHPTMGRILVAVGGDAQMLQYSYTDTGTYPWQPPSWNAETLELRRDLRSVWLTADGGLGWTVGLDGELVSLDVPARRYVRSMTPTSDHLLGVWGVSGRDAWAVGGRSTGVLLHSR